MSKTARDALLARARFEDTASLFGADDVPMDWQREWVGMPEYLMGNTEPVQKITVSFSSQEDVRLFCERLGIKASARTDSIWFPGDRDYLAPSHMIWAGDE